MIGTFEVHPKKNLPTNFCSLLHSFFLLGSSHILFSIQSAIFAKLYNIYVKREQDTVSHSTCSPFRLAFVGIAIDGPMQKTNYKKKQIEFWRIFFLTILKSDTLSLAVIDFFLLVNFFIRLYFIECVIFYFGRHCLSDRFQFLIRKNIFRAFFYVVQTFGRWIWNLNKLLENLQRMNQNWFQIFENFMNTFLSLWMWDFDE